MNELIEMWAGFVEGAEGASEVTLTPEYAEASGQEPDGATWAYYQNADENFIRLTDYDEGK